MGAEKEATALVFQPIQEPITKREYFAAMILQGMAASVYWAENFTPDQKDLSKPINVAVLAADELLNQLKQ